MKQKIYIATVCLALIPFGTQATHASTIENAPVSLLICPADAVTFTSKRPKETDRLFRSDAVEKEIQRIVRQLTNKRLCIHRRYCSHVAARFRGTGVALCSAG